MKILISLLLFAIASVVPGFAQWAVVDVPALQQSVINYTAMTKQIANQAAQIANQVAQIKQFEAQLERLGDMSKLKNLVGFAQFRLDLNLPTQVKKWADGMARVDGSDLFGDTRGGIFPQINMQFPDFDGKRVNRDPLIFKPSQDIVATVDEFKTVQGDVYTRREDLKRAIAETSDALQAATTEAEEQKLQAVLAAQYGQLSAVDSEVTLSAAEVQVKTAEATAMTNAQENADAEARRTLSQQEAIKLSTSFTPMYDCMLQYVSERPLSP
jgi:hypothetical protein